MPTTLLRLPIFLVTATLFCHCSSHSKPAKKQVIGLQPIGHYNRAELQFIQKELLQFYNSPVVILKERAMPATFIDLSKGERYSADSIIKWLAQVTPDSISKVVGLTHEDIFTTVREWGFVKEPESRYAVWGIFGLGYQPGRSSVVSDHRLKTPDTRKFHHRLRTVVIHELGHNMGLPHCATKSCIMNDANEKIQTVDNSADDYCELCRNSL